MNREKSFASVEYEISEPGGTHWFIARMMPLEDSTDGAVISHEDVTDRMLAHRALGDANKRLQVLSKRVLSIQEAERRDISRELHDDIGQSLTALTICMHRLEQRTKDEHKELIADCLHIADSTLNKLRNLSLALRPPQLDQLGLEDALKWLADQQHSVTGLEIECKFAGMTERLPAGLEGACYRITQEALNNATRHASAKKIRVEVERNDRLLTLKIRDDGTGFDMELARMKAMKMGSLGLISMEERAQLAGGRLQIRSGPGAGTKVMATFVIGSPTSRNTDGDSEQNSADTA